MNMFRRRSVPMGVALLGLLMTVVQAQADEATALATIRELGGRIGRDNQRPGEPVVAVDFNFTQATDANLKDLKDLPDLEALTLDKTTYPHPKRRSIGF